MRKIYIKESACIGCRLCEVYCRLEHSRSDDLVKAFNRESPSAISRCLVEVNKPVSLSVRCHSCEDAPCVLACLTGALQRDPITGIVAVDEEKCIGCWTCILSCPFGAVRRDTQLGKIIKCDLCGDKEIPVCVSNCPNEALVCEYE